MKIDSVCFTWKGEKNEENQVYGEGLPAEGSVLFESPGGGAGAQNFKGANTSSATLH